MSTLAIILLSVAGVVFIGTMGWLLWLVEKRTPELKKGRKTAGEGGWFVGGVGDGGCGGGGGDGGGGGG